MKDPQKYLFLLPVPLLILFRWPIESKFTVFGWGGLLLFAASLFVMGTYRIVSQKDRIGIPMVFVALALSVCFWFGLFKSPVVGRAELSGGMDDFSGELVLRENGKCEIWSYVLFDRELCECKYGIEGHEVVIDGCDWAKEFDEIRIGSKSYMVR